MAGYRDDNAALQAKVAELEGELAASKSHVDRLKGLTRAPKKNDSLVGAPVHHLDTLTLPGVVSDAGCAAIARVLESRLGLSTSIGQGSVTGAARGWLAADGRKTFSLSREGDETRLRLETDAQRLPVLVALGPLLGGLSSLPYALWQMNLLHHFEPGESLTVTLAIAAGSTVFVGWLTRAWAKRRARALGRAHDGAWAAVTELSRERQAPQVRVAVRDAQAAVAEDALAETAAPGGIPTSEPRR